MNCVPPVFSDRRASAGCAIDSLLTNRWLQMIGSSSLVYHRAGPSNSQPVSLPCLSLNPFQPRITKSKDHGTIRLYSADGERSTVATLTLSTTAGQIAQNYKVDSLYLQTGNFHIRFVTNKAPDTSFGYSRTFHPLIFLSSSACQKVKAIVSSRPWISGN